ncbi:hypothetical protein CVT24_002282 [Panaeolus cyanescens]|uniref:G domain-containing protein n=1 Tax=Panaeolus cyanescens TaxID=181874 RepID=A0A409YIT5_9AGAR|nr:hypothetical protein CVT24_002282 [Panaeolus cyanescens]
MTSKAEEIPRLKNLKIGGAPLVVRPLGREKFPHHSYRILIMGPTGAGKSSFVEAVAGPQSGIKISSGQLEGYTQEVTAYRIRGMTCNSRPIYLIDTPGFADAKVSDFQILTNVQQWVKDKNLLAVTKVLYIHPVTATRLPGSQKAVLSTFKALTGISSARDITVVTSMWDTALGKPSLRRAQSNFTELKREVWKDFLKDGANITRFYNTHASALRILDQVLSAHLERNMFQVFAVDISKVELFRTPFGQNLEKDLINRIKTLKMKKTILEADLDDPSTLENEELASLLQTDLLETNQSLERFMRQIREVCPPRAAKHK